MKTLLQNSLIKYKNQLLVYFLHKKDRCKSVTKHKTMNRITTKYLGLTLKNPVIISSSPFTSTLDGIVAAEKAGAGAVVLKSIFEEQINSEIALADSYSDYPEAADYVKSYVTENSLNAFVDLIKSAKAACSIPIIASINCTVKGNWVDFATLVEKAGADAIELNVFFMPTSKEESAEQIETQYLATIGAVRDAITIPMSVKLSQNFTNILSVAKEIYYRNVKGVTLYNRFFTPDIDIEKMSVVNSNIWSSHSEIYNVIRGCGMISAQVPLLDIATSTGVRNGEDAVKMMLCGAKAVQICTVVHEQGLEVVGEINNFILSWMKKHNFSATLDFIGKANHKNIENNTAYERTQFMKYYSSAK